MGEAKIAPLYLSVGWTFIISYQLLTQKAVVTVIGAFTNLLPEMSTWLFSRVNTIVFIHAFAWIFLLSSVIPSCILGKERGVTIQFLFCLTLTLGSIWVEDALALIGNTRITEEINVLSHFFSDPLYAGLFLLLPYIFMISLDMYSRHCKTHGDSEEGET